MAKREWKWQNASENGKMRVKKAKREWKRQNASEKGKTRVKKSKREWKWQNASELIKSTLTIKRRTDLSESAWEEKDGRIVWRRRRWGGVDYNIQNHSQLEKESGYKAGSLKT